MLYVDLCRSTELSQRVDAEVYADIMDVLKAFYGEKIAAHGGTLLQLHGDGLLAMFGFPAAGEEDVRLAVNAALDLHEHVETLHAQLPELAEIKFSLALHSGVHAGLVVVKDGDIYAGSFQLRSEVTNICARLSGAAGDGEILVSEESLGGSTPYFNCGPRQELDLRGVEEPVNVVSVLGRSSLSTRDQARRKRSRLPFVGRHDEQALLNECLHEVRQGGLHVVGVTGAPGVGKSRLIDEFAHELGVDLVVRVAADPPATARPLHPFTVMLEALQNTQSALLESCPERDWESADGIYAFFGAVLARQSLVLVIDDWHWLDDGSRDLVRRLVANREWPLLILFSSRYVEPTDTTLLKSLTELKLDGLSSLEVDQAVKALLPHIDPFIADKIGALCGGNPLFLEELCHSDTIEKLDHAPSRVEHVPQWLYSVVQARVARLSQVDLQIVQTAAVIGKQVPLWLLSRVSDYEAGGDLTALAAADLLFPSEVPDEWRFKHGLTREIVYDLVGLRKRQALHRHIAQALHESGSRQDENLAYHYFGGAMYEEAVPHALGAGDRAMRLPALDVAAVQYRLAVDCLDRGDVTEATYQRVFGLVRKLNNVSMLDPDPEHIAVLKRALDLAKTFDDKRGLALANYWLGTAYYGIGMPREALKYHFRARTLAQEVGHHRLVLETNSTIAQTTAANCDNRVALPLLDKAINAHGPTEEGSADRMSVCYTLGCKAMALGDMGDIDGATRVSDLAVEWLAGSGNPVAANVLAMWVCVRIWGEDWRQAEEGAARLQQLTHKIRNIYLFGMARSLGAYTRWRVSGEQAAAEELVEATGWLESYGKGQFLSLNFGWLTTICCEYDDVPQVRKYAAKAIKRARIGDRFGEAMTYRTLAEVAHRNGWRQPWQAYLDRADHSAEARDSTRDRVLNAACRDALSNL